MKKSLMVAAATAMLALALAACASGGSSSNGTSSAAAGTPQHGGNLVMARADEVQSLVPWVPTDNASIWTLEEIYDTLLVPEPNGHGVEASLATSWSESANKLSWTFHLRHGVEFSNGQPLTSADVKFSLAQASKPNTPFYFIDQVIKSVLTPDPYTVVITTKQPWAPLPADMALYANSIVPNNYGGESASGFAGKPIGSGPFMLSSWIKGQSLKLVKNPHYWQKGKPYLNSVTFTVVADANTRATQVTSGQAQVDEFPAYSSITALSAGSTKVGVFDSSRVDYFVMNTNKAPFTNPEVRLAVAQAVNRAALIKTVQFGYGTAAKGYMSPVLWAYDPSLTPPAYSLAAAKADLARSSVPHGFSTTITVAAGNDNEESAAQLIQASLAEIGIKATIATLDPSALFTAQQNGNFDMSFAYQTTDIVDPDEIIRFAGLYSGGSNTLYTFYKNAQLEAMANKADTLSSQAARQQLYDQIQQTINQESPYVALYYSPSVYAYGSNVHDFHPYPTGNYNLVDTWISG
jgi:peptide/nickel transport system substrate-binding protein